MLVYPSHFEHIEHIGPEVIVFDQSTGERICDAMVVGNAGTRSNLFSSWGPDEFGPPWHCSYMGNMGIGPFSITASRGDYEPATIDHAVLGWDGCDIVSQTYTLVLRRRPRGYIPAPGVWPPW